MDAIADNKPETIEKDGQIYRLDRNGYYRNKHGHLMKGQNLAAMRELRRQKKERKQELLKATPTEMRAYLNNRMQEVLDVLLDAAIKDKDVAAASLLVSKCLPTLKSIEHTGEGNQLPTLVINQLVAPSYPQAGSYPQSDNDARPSTPKLIHSHDAQAVDKSGDEPPVPDFLDSDSPNIQSVDNFSNLEDLESTGGSGSDEKEDESDMSPRIVFTPMDVEVQQGSEGSGSDEIDSEERVEGFLEKPPV